MIDPMTGSSSVGVMCQRNSRDFVGVDVSPLYIELSRERLETEK